ncbi:MAG: hypothetical protein BWY80_01291 [Firmicutes bacterium ADurb.Bin456]|nr:MAG: hypothetical protein BWY80_01291 [Firmicutes bacterium ADurb.Bin456]
MIILRTGFYIVLQLNFEEWGERNRMPSPNGDLPGSGDNDRRMSIGIKRIYRPAEKKDGKRILVDRLWPRGVTKQNAQLDEWLKDVAPSPQLRTWFGHKNERFDAFALQYRLELDTDPLKQSAIRHLLAMYETGEITLLYGAKSDTINHARVLQQYLQEKLAGQKPRS